MCVCSVWPLGTGARYELSQVQGNHFSLIQIFPLGHITLIHLLVHPVYYIARPIHRFDLYEYKHLYFDLFLYIVTRNK